MKKLSFVILFFLSSFVFAEYQKNSPFFYAALAEASYQKGAARVQRKMDQLFGKRIALVVDYKTIRAYFGASTDVILVRDIHGLHHIVYEGSDDLGDWLGNVIVNPTRGTFYEYDVTKSVDLKMHRLMMIWKQKVGKITTIIGHSRGGMFASQVAHKHKNDYRGVQVITFNAYKPKAASNQLHLAVKSEHASTLLSSNGRYKQLPIGRGHWRLYSNHKMKFFLSGLKDKNWSFIL